MARALASAVVVALLIPAPSNLHAQPTPQVEFEVVSIKRNTSGPLSVTSRTLLDGTVMVINAPIRYSIENAAPERVTELIGLPEWVFSDRYDIIAKPPAGSTREQWPLMWRSLFAERLKLVAHMEQRQRDGFAIVLARSDGRLGPQLKPAIIDCPPPAPGDARPPRPTSAADFETSCAMLLRGGGITSGSTTLATLASGLGGLLGDRERSVPVTNRTGLDGRYAVKVTYTPPTLSAQATSVDGAPDLFTAFEEQLGLKLQPEKTVVPVFVIDHIERPSEN
jgi:uncharacterized protein (TIGR03435 family)